ncbi:MAG: M28 family metallopeptidase, partial [Candidatus Helarchaeota archaeon]|nr:M28 family metallopeptidase [Candidatus Helarchaeota archaeon]
EGYVYFLIGGIGALFICPAIFVAQIILSITGNLPDVILVINWVAILLPIGLTVGFLTIVAVSVYLLGPKAREKILFGAFTKITPITFLLLLGLLGYYLLYNIFLFNYVMTDVSLFKTALLLILAVLPYFTALFFFINKKGVPGALDNLSAIAISVCVAKILKDWKDHYPHLLPKNTEVVIALVGCEEIGCRGSGSFAKTHAAEYNQIDTTCIAMDTMGDPELLRILKRESSTRTDFDPPTFNLLADCAKELHLNYKILDQPWVSGGTDASGIAKGGLRGAAMIGLYFGHYLYYYHSDRDDISIINKERRSCTEYGTDWYNRNMRCAFENALKVCVRYLQKKDIEK